MAGFPYRLHGGALREDALQFDPAFNQALVNLYTSAPPAVQRELGLTSGYRSPAVQQVLWDKSDKTGRTVARPGKSKHQHGTAADLYGFGLGGGKVSQTTRDWVVSNAAKHGLAFPMNYEPWHIQLVGPGGGGGLADTMAEAAVSEADIGKQQLYAGLAKGLGASSGGREPASPDVVGDPTGAAQMVSLPITSALPAVEALPRISPVVPTLADLFQLKDVGAAAMPTRPVRRA